MERLKKYKPRELKGNRDIEEWNAGKIQAQGSELYWEICPEWQASDTA